MGLLEKRNLDVVQAYSWGAPHEPGPRVFDGFTLRHHRVASSYIGLFAKNTVVTQSVGTSRPLVDPDYGTSSEDSAFGTLKHIPPTLTTPPFEQWTIWDEKYAIRNQGGYHLHPAKAHAVRINLRIPQLPNGTFYFGMIRSSATDAPSFTNFWGFRYSTAASDPSIVALSATPSDSMVHPTGIGIGDASHWFEWRWYRKERVDFYLDGVRIAKNEDLNTIPQDDTLVGVILYLKHGGGDNAIMEYSRTEAFFDI
jgi:hypothetical protein